MPYIPIGSCRIHYEDIPIDSPYDLVFLHGNLAANLWWQPCLEFFPRSRPDTTASKRALLIEWRGCGQSGPVRSPLELNLSRMARDILCVIEELCPGPVVVVGHSMGGLLALTAMALCPQLFQGAFLLAPVHPKGIIPSEAIRRHFLAMRDDTHYCASIMATTIKDIKQNPALFSEIILSAQQASPFLWEGIVDALAKPDLQALLFRVSHRVRILHGALDPVLPAADSEDLTRCLASAEFRLLPYAGHSYNVEQPEAFAKELLSFLRSLDETPPG